MCGYKITILLSLLIIIFLLITYKIVYLHKYINKLDIKYLSSVLNTLKSGDIILFSLKKLAFTNVLLAPYIYFTHCGIIIKKDNKLYITETNPKGELIPYLDSQIKKKIGCTDIMPLYQRIKYYPGDCFLMRLNKPLDVKREQILINTTYEKYPYPTIVQIIRNYFTKKNTPRHCFQHVGFLLDKMGITNNISNYDSLFICKKIAYLCGQPLNDGYKYIEPIKIVLP